MPKSKKSSDSTASKNVRYSGTGMAMTSQQVVEMKKMLKKKKKLQKKSLRKK